MLRSSLRPKRTKRERTSSGEQPRVAENEGASKARRTIEAVDAQAPLMPVYSTQFGATGATIGTTLSPDSAAAACGVVDSGRHADRPRALPSPGVQAQLNRWLLMRCGVWNRVWKVLTPVLWGSAVRCPSTATGLSINAEAHHAHQHAKAHVTAVFTLPETFDKKCDIVAFAAVQLSPVNSGNVADFRVQSAWPRRAVHLSVNGAAVPSVAPGAADALRTRAAIESSSRATRAAASAARKRGAQQSPAPPVVPQPPAYALSDVLNIGHGCAPGRNTLEVHTALQASMAFRVYLCRPTWQMRASPAQLLSQASSFKLKPHVSVAALRLAAGATAVGPSSDVTIPPNASTAFRSACEAGQLSAVQALLGRTNKAEHGEEHKVKPLPDDVDDELQLETSSIVVSLTDPLTQDRMSMPVRGAHCAHVACFDLETWLQFVAEQASQFPPRCPVCSSVLHLSELVRDDAQATLIACVQQCQSKGVLGTAAQEHTLSTTTPSEQVEILSDGSWRAVVG